MRPGVIGGANWGGGAFDPETGCPLREDEPLAGRDPHSSRRTDPPPTRARPRSTPTSSATAAAGRRSRRPARGRRASCRSPSRPTASSSRIDLNTGAIALARPVRRHAVGPQPSGAPGRRAARAPRRRRRARRHRHRGRPHPRRRRRHRAVCIRQGDWPRALARRSAAPLVGNADDVPHQVGSSVRRHGDWGRE